MTHTSLFEQLGRTRSASLLEESESISTQHFGLGAIQQPDADPILGLNYRCDFKCEEETGVGELRKQLTSDDPRRFKMTRNASKNVAVFNDVNGLMLSTRNVHPTLQWGDHINPFAHDVPDYVRHFQDGFYLAVGGYALQRKDVTTLRQEAKDLGIAPLPRRKADLIEKINQANMPDDIMQWPGWFQNGRNLVLRADNGPVADALEVLRRAAVDGHLAIGSGSGIFSSGLFLYDARDESRGLKQQRKVDFDWYDARMAALKPVADDLRENFLGYYFLGNPAVLDTGDGRQVTRYWLNSHTTSHAADGRQIYGWFTLDELRDRSFVDKFNGSRAKHSA